MREAVAPKTWRDLGEVVPRPAGISMLVGIGIVGFFVSASRLTSPAVLMMALFWIYRWGAMFDVDLPGDGRETKTAAEAFVMWAPLAWLAGYTFGWLNQLGADVLTLALLVHYGMAPL